MWTLWTDSSNTPGSLSNAHRSSTNCRILPCLCSTAFPSPGTRLESVFRRWRVDPGWSCLRPSHKHTPMGLWWFCFWRNGNQWRIWMSRVYAFDSRVRKWLASKTHILLNTLRKAPFAHWASPQEISGWWERRWVWVWQYDRMTGW